MTSRLETAVWAFCNPPFDGVVRQNEAWIKTRMRVVLEALAALPPTEAEVEAVGKTIWGLNWSRDPWQIETAERALTAASAARKGEKL